jgi:hypothetical protein
MDASRPIPNETGDGAYRYDRGCFTVLCGTGCAERDQHAGCIFVALGDIFVPLRLHGGAKS